MFAELVVAEGLKMFFFCYWRCLAAVRSCNPNNLRVQFKGGKHMYEKQHVLLHAFTYTSVQTYLNA